ncbi:hypothetical protein J7E63_21700 [Bacillus sp. ISL-75]|uniref:hypothetical protein n=1 Tax=Bacillus sp. ISL-75 TaxID=2819137 RepID=UPI001BE4FA28|nr:hypothetical protein [Bacillus sp. ISL-75]MBT2729511.1 hypothetical protein [Bacillus sp. ISL-75]
MRNKDLIVSVFEKEIGPLKNERDSIYDNGSVYTFEFLHKSNITLRILLMEIKTNHWVIHHELSRENPFLLKRVVRTCERIQRIEETKFVSFSLSADLKDIQQERFLTTAVKCALQNGLNHLTLFRQDKEKPTFTRKGSLEIKVNK